MLAFRDTLIDIIFFSIHQSILNEGKCYLQHSTENLRDLINTQLIAIKSSALITAEGVNYSALANSPEYLKLKQEIAACLQTFDLRVLSSQAEKLGFWINIYNLLSIDGVIHHRVKNSITEGWFGVIGFFRKTAYQIGGMRFSLEDIEHGILRSNRGVPFFPGRPFSANDVRMLHIVQNLDPRVHFALNCASQSCPPIAFYTSSEIDRQLDLAAENFMNQSILISKGRQSISVSQIFHWYQADFGGKQGILRFILHYLPEADFRRKFIIANFDEIAVLYQPYDWQLNAIG